MEIKHNKINKSRISIGCSAGLYEDHDAHLKNSIIKDKSLFHSASVSNLYIGTNRNVRADFSSRIYIGSLIDEARLDNGRATALVSRS